MIAVFNTRMTRGQTLRMTLTAKDERGRPRDLTDAKVYFAMRADIKVAPSVQLTSDSDLADTVDSGWRLGIVLLSQSGSTLGQSVLTMIPGDTSGLVALGDDDPWLYEVWIVESTGDTWPVITTSKLGLYPEVVTIPS